MSSKSSASVSVLPTRSGRLRPPSSLGEAERVVFAELVAACKSTHFQPSDLPLLARYCEAAVLGEQAAEHLRTEGPVIAGHVSPWVTVQEKAMRAMVALSMRLRLSPQARQANNPTRPQPANIYERMAIERGQE
jgi:P27 family predicted phage terminase small subunit